MPRPPSRHPTDLELEILHVLWRDGPATGRQVRERLARPLAYTSVATVLNIMARKRYVGRRKPPAGEGPGFVYRALVNERATARGMLADLLRRAFRGSSSALLVGLLEEHDLDDRELARLRELIDRKATDK